MRNFSAENRTHFTTALAQRASCLKSQAVCVLRTCKRDMSWFYYLFGVKPTSQYVGVIEMGSGKVTLFHEEGKACADLEVRKNEEVSHFFQESKIQQVFVLEGINSDTGEKVDLSPNWKELKSVRVERESGFQILSECRVFKSEYEVARLRKAQQVAAEAVALAMKSAKPGCLQESLSVGMSNLCKVTYKLEDYAFPTIVAAGKNIANLRHFEGDSVIKAEDMVLVDFSITVDGYASDLTGTFPANGKFTPRQKQIYELVLKANRRVIQESKPGVWWVDLHLLAERIILEGLQKLGVIKQEADINGAQNEGIGTLFFPNGVGHLVGLDIQDVGGYLSHTPKRSERINLKQLRHGRVLEAGMVTSVEPGCYFDIKKLDSFASKIINEEIFLEFAEEVGGVRIEDVILITENGCEVLTPDEFPRSVEEVESFMIGSK